MSLITLLTYKSPTIAGIEFDAVFEDVIEGAVETTGYTIESGAQAADHAIVLPFKYSVLIGIGDNPLQTAFTDFAGGLVSNATDNGILTTIAGLSAGFLSGGNGTRASAALSSLITLMVTREPFDVDAGDLQLSNMLITNIQRVKTPINEGALIARVDMQEYPTLETLYSEGAQPSGPQLNDNDPAKTQATSFLEKGERALKDAGEAVTDAVSGIFS